MFFENRPKCSKIDESDLQHVQDVPYWNQAI